MLSSLTTSQKFPTGRIVEGWESLKKGESVEIHSVGSCRYVASVDMRTDDGRYAWVIERETGSRRLLVSDDESTTITEFAC